MQASTTIGARGVRSGRALALVSLVWAMIVGAGQAQTPPAFSADLGDGTYRNPVLAGDYSDPDVVRVGDAYYLTASSFANAPGLPILKSADLVNWTLIGHALPKVTPADHYATPRRGGGVWAPAIRHRDGKFLIYYPDPDRGIFLITADDAAGPWSAPVLVEDSPGVIDPAPFWDDDGQGWLVYAFAGSRAGFSNIVAAKRLNATGDKTVGEAHTLIDGGKLALVYTDFGRKPWFTTEGPKLYKRDGWYYVFAPAGSVKGGWQGVFRARALLGPYEGRNVLDQGKTQINGPHQGAWVTTAQNEEWFLHFQDADSYGRRVWLEPMAWKNGWPMIGEDPDGDGRGQPVLRHRKPKIERAVAPTSIETNDTFDGVQSLAWQWNANPGEDWSSLTARPGHLRLKSVSSPENLWEAGAVLTRKLPAERFTATTKISFAAKAVGERAGLVMLGADYGWIGLEKTAEGVRLIRVDRLGADAFQPEQVLVGLPSAPSVIHLRLRATPVTVVDPPPNFPHYAPSMLRSLHARVQFSYSLDGQTYVPLGAPFVSKPGRWVGAQLGVFSQAAADRPAFSAPRVGWTDVDSFEVTP